MTIIYFALIIIVILAVKFFLDKETLKTEAKATGGIRAKYPNLVENAMAGINTRVIKDKPYELQIIHEGYPNKTIWTMLYNFDSITVCFELLVNGQTIIRNWDFETNVSEEQVLFTINTELGEAFAELN